MGALAQAARYCGRPPSASGATQPWSSEVPALGIFAIGSFTPYGDAERELNPRWGCLAESRSLVPSFDDAVGAGKYDGQEHRLSDRPRLLRIFPGGLGPRH